MGRGVGISKGKERGVALQGATIMGQHPPPFLSPHLVPHLGHLLPGSRQIQLTVPGAYEKPQFLPLNRPKEGGHPTTFTFHVNPMISSRLDVELGEKLRVLEVSEPIVWEGVGERISPV